MPLAPSRPREVGYHCYCPTCDFEILLEEGQKCNLIECPQCDSRMRTATTRISEETNPVESVVKTIFVSVLTGIGIALGFRIVQKVKI